MLELGLISAGAACSACSAAGPSTLPAPPPPASEDADVQMLNKTRTLVLEAAPACDVPGQRPSPGAGGALEVGADAVSLRVEFDLGTARLATDAAQRLDRLASTLKDPALAGARFLVTGHTDTSGSDAINVPLSCNRAKAVRDHLLSRGFDPARLDAVGFGARRPLDGTPAADAANRRVEIRRLVPQKASP